MTLALMLATAVAVIAVMLVTLPFLREPTPANDALLPPNATS